MMRATEAKMRGKTKAYLALSVLGLLLAALVTF